jgi:hypothetical protein
MAAEMILHLTPGSRHLDSHSGSDWEQVVIKVIHEQPNKLSQKKNEAESTVSSQNNIEIKHRMKSIEMQGKETEMRRQQRNY